ncbi:MAG: hypothetical protein L0G71_00535 [Yaniella sp.]|nr:hypothetical protein [Yaniella sp.]
MQNNPVHKNVDTSLKSVDTSPESSPRAIAQRWVDQLHRALTSATPASAAEVFET